MRMPDFAVRFLYAMRLGGLLAPASEVAMVETVFRMYRHNSGADSTLGKIFAPDNKTRLCFTCEDERRDVKVMHETRIPAGKYEILLRTEGGMHPKYASKFPDIHKGMLWLQDVENFEWVYIHVGNTEKHSSGCILVGMNEYPDVKNGGGSVGSSKTAYRLLYPMIADAIERGDRVFIEISDNDYPEGL